MRSMSGAAARAARIAGLTVLVLAYLTLAPTSLLHTDLARDLRVAEDILAQRNFPLVGPPLAGVIHLGPVWYYLLALLVSLPGGWASGVWLLYLLGAAQFPLAYLAGKVWFGRGAGMLWAFLLVLPSWSLVEQLFPTHTLLTAPLLLAVIVAAGRYRKTARPKFLAAGALLFALAIHAHPTALVLLPVLLAQLLLALKSGLVGWRYLTLATAAFALPFLPMLGHQWWQAQGPLAQIATYVTWSSFPSTALENAPRLIWQLLGGGLEYQLALTIASPSGIPKAAGVFAGAILGIGILVEVFRAAKGQATSRVALLTLLSGFSVLVLLRSVVPYYMTTALHTILLGVAAAGLDAAARRLGRPDIWRGAIALGGLAGFLVVAVAGQRLERTGAWPFAFLPLLDVKQAGTTQKPLALQMAKAIVPSDRWFCANRPLAMHGSYATALVLDYGREIPSCSTSSVVVGGAEVDRAHWIGLSRAMWNQLRIDPDVSLGAFGLTRANRVAPPASRVIAPRLTGYPPIPYDRRPPVNAVSFDIDLVPGDVLVIAHLGFPMQIDPILRVTEGSQEISPLSSDWASAAFPAPPSRPVRWHVEARAADPSLIDVTVLRATQAPRSATQVLPRDGA